MSRLASATTTSPYDLWIADVEALTLEGAWAPDASELARWRSIQDPSARRRFAAGAVLARQAVASALNVEPAVVQFDRTCDRCARPHGRPQLRSPWRPELRLSVAHSMDVAVVAVSMVGPVGVDVEVASRGRDYRALHPRMLHRSERHQLDAGSDPWRVLRTWVRKEAVMKGLGLGLRLAPTSFAVSAPELAPQIFGLPREVAEPRLQLEDDGQPHAPISVAFGWDGADSV